MSYLDVYIGDLEDPHFSWDGGNWSGNTPKSLSNLFPPGRPRHGDDPFFGLIHKIRDGQYEGKQVDWGAWVAKVNKKQIEAFIADHYDDGMYEHFPHLQKKLDALLTFMHGLEEDKLYALVASEL